VGFSARGVAAMTEANGRHSSTRGWRAGLASRQIRGGASGDGAAPLPAMRWRLVRGKAREATRGPDRIGPRTVASRRDRSPHGDREGVWQRSRSRSRSSRSLRSDREVRVAAAHSLFEGAHRRGARESVVRSRPAEPGASRYPASARIFFVDCMFRVTTFLPLS